MKKLALLTLITLGLAAGASAQNLICDPYFLTNLPAVVNPFAVSNVTTTPITVRNNYGLSVSPTWTAGSNCTAAGLVLNFAVSVDGTNYTTTRPFVMVSLCNGLSGVIDYTNFPALSSFAKLRLVSITNATAGTNYLTNICVGRGR